jgi:hypothetical protein
MEFEATAGYPLFFLKKKEATAGDPSEANRKFHDTVTKTITLVFVLLTVTTRLIYSLLISLVYCG